MFRCVNSSPVLFAQPLEIKNRQRFRRFKSVAEKMSNLLSDRSVLALRPSLELFVERVGKVLDVQYCHLLTPKLLHNGGPINDLSRLMLAPKISTKVCDPVIPATSEALALRQFRACFDMPRRAPLLISIPKRLTRLNWRPREIWLSQSRAVRRSLDDAA